LSKSLHYSTAPLNAQVQLWVFASLALVMLPHAARLPWWILVFAIVIAVWHFLPLRRGRQRASRLLVFAATLAGAVGVFLQYGTLLGKNAGVALLVVMLTLKLLELHRMRDVLLVIFLSYFLVITNFLFTQTLFIAIYMMLTTVVITASLAVATQSRTVHPVMRQLQFAATLMAQAAPLMLVLFVFFPRVTGPIWGLPKDAYSGLTGLSDRMSPGTISQLVQSEAPAFRVSFSGAAPPAGQRYWRGPVLWRTDGRNWSAGEATAMLPSVTDHTMQTVGESVHQSIALEGQGTRWLIGLDVPVEVSMPAIHKAGFQWLSKRRLYQRTRYEVISYPRLRTRTLDPRLREAALQLPDTLSRRVRALARGWRDSAGTDSEVVQLALDYFHNEPFVYTLTPPSLGKDPVDEFLFSSRQGFCEHYAAAFVILMRSAGIPARVVTGYLGGEYNPVGDYWLIRQSDAHAWAEVWLPGTGWQRFDPTAAVAPERIEYAIDPGIQLSGEPIRFHAGEVGLLSRGWRRLRYSLDAINSSWDRWVPSYGPELQREVLTRFGFKEPSWKDMTLVSGLLVGVLLGGMAGCMLVKRSVPSDPVLRAYRTFCARAVRLGIHRPCGEGPLDFSRRINSVRPDLAAQVNTITDLFIGLRYGCPMTDPGHHIARLQRLVRRFPRGAVKTRPLMRHQ
jgi:transglutaminase-like putative cysteine protease